MSLRKKTTVVTGITIILLIILMYGIHTMLIKRSFLELEREDTLHKLSHISLAVQKETETINSLINYNSLIEELNYFIEGKNEKKFSESVENIFTSFHLDLLVYSGDSAIHYYKRYEQNNIQYNYINYDSLLNFPSPNKSGIIIFVEELYLVASIFHSNSKMNNEDKFFMIGKSFNAAFFEQYTDIDKNNIEFILTNSAEWNEIFSYMQNKETDLHTLIEHEELFGYVLLFDEMHNPVSIIKVNLPRTIYEQGESIFRFTILLIVLIGIFVYIVIMLFFEITVLSNVKDLGNQVNYIAESDDETAQINIKVRDEIGQLAQKINRMIRIKRIADKALRESEHFHKVIFESSDDAFVIVNEKEEAIYTNQKFHQLLGYTTGDIANKQYYDLILPSKEKEFLFTSNYLSKKIFPVETKLKRKDGFLIDAEIVRSSINIKNNPCTLERYTDITEKKKAEGKIRESHERFLSIFQSAEDIILTIDKRGIIHSVNNYGISFSNKTVEEIEGKHISSVFGLNEDHLLIKIIEEVIKTGNKRIEEITLNQNAYLNIAVTKMIDNISGEPVALVIGRDITTIKVLEEEARKNQLQLQQADKLASLGLLVAGVAHEINNPVSFISFNVPYIEQYFSEIFPLLDEHAAKNPGYKIANVEYELFKKDIKDMLSDLYEGAQRITGIVADLKTFSKMETENENTFIELEEIINSTIRLLQPAIKKKKASIHYRGEKKYSIKGNKQKIGQVIINLLTNALDAVETGSGEINVSISKCKKSLSLVIAVKDNGIGISEKDTPLIFDPFFTTKSFTGGTGLGLSVAKSIIENMGLQIHFESKQGYGTTFFITIPEESYK